MSLRILSTFLAAAGLAFATDGGRHYHWTGHVAPGQLIEIKGVNGSVRAESTTGRNVEVYAEKTGRRYDPADVRIEVVPNGNGTTICAVYPSRTGRPNGCRPGAAGQDIQNNDVKVEFTVRVPKGVRFTGRTVNGGIYADHLGADVEAHTTNGKIALSTSGTALARTVNGSIHAILGKAEWNGARLFSAVNGSIEVEVPGNTNADVSASTVNGRIVTDFPITVHGRFVNRNLHGTLGSGGRELRIHTVNGSITLRSFNAA